MKLFHGSIIEVLIPKILETQKLVDFGKGFYTTTSQEQAEKWAKIKQKRLKEKEAIISCYHLNDEIFMDSKFRILEFQKADESWLKFVVKNIKTGYKHGFDLVKGAVANDTLYTTLLLFEIGVLNESKTINRLKTHQLFDQISFHNIEILKELNFEKSYKI